MEYNQKLKELRVQNDMSQEQIAQLLHVTRQTVSKWEQGINQPDIYTLKQYSQIFGVSLDELVGDIEKKEKPTSNRRKACKTLLMISTAFYVFCVITVFILFRFLQDTIPAHHNVHGEIDRYGSKAEVLLHLISFTVFYALTVMTYMIGKRNLGTPLLNLENTSFIVILSLVVAIPVGYLAFVLAISVPYLIEHSVYSFIMCILAEIELVIAVTAHPKLAPANYLLGFRTKFTITNPEAWVKVNRFASICISVATVLTIAANMILISWWALLGSWVTLFVALAISFIYHEALRKRMSRIKAN